MKRELHGAITLAAVFFASVAHAAEPKISESKPATIGSRSAVVEFTGSETGKTGGNIISTESLALSDMALALIAAGKIKPGMKGVSEVGPDRYRLEVTYPVANDGAPLTEGMVPPVPRVRPAPAFPYELRRQGIAGGAILKLHIDEKARVQKVELVASSHPEFGAAAIEAVKKWVFGKPAMHEGKPVASTMIQLMEFEYDGKHAPLQWRISPEPKLTEYVTWVTVSPTK